MSNTHTDFNAFLEDFDGSPEDVHSLYHAVADVTTMGPFECVEGNRPDTWLVKAPLTESLFLATPQAKQAFLDTIEERYVVDGMNIDAWREMHYFQDKE